MVVHGINAFGAGLIITLLGVFIIAVDLNPTGIVKLVETKFKIIWKQQN